MIRRSSSGFWRRRYNRSSLRVERNVGRANSCDRPVIPGWVVMRRVVPAEPLDVLLSQRPRPDHAHFTSQHIDELRQLVDASAAQPATDPGDMLLAHAA